MERAPSLLCKLAAFALAILAGCTAAREIGGDVAYEVGPFGSTDLAVRSVEVHGPYLLVDLEGRREQLRFLAPADATCAALLQPEARLSYAKSGLFGRVSSAAEHCDLTGIASLSAWRDRQPRRRGGLVPRSTARFTLLHQDASMLLVRGRFPGASRLGIPAAYDLVALLPNDAACREALTRGAVTLEYRPAGSDPLRLMVGDAACVVAGIAIPPPGP